MKKFILGMLMFCGFINFAEAAVCGDELHCNASFCVEGKCRKCQSGYTAIMNGKCGEISSLIPHCSSAGYSLCIVCSSGYLSYDGKCITKGECNAKGYKKLDGLCVSQECTKTNSSICDTCSSGVAQGNRCVAECEEGFVLSNNRCIPKNCSSFSYTCLKCSSGYLQDGICVEKCKTGYIEATNRHNASTCVPENMGCGYHEIRVGDKCVDEKECSLENGFRYNAKTYECYSKTRYTLPEADELTSDDNENMIEWIFE